MTFNQPLKINENLTLYSGDVIKLNNSEPVLIEICLDSTFKLREITENCYLSKSFTSLKFDRDFNHNDSLSFAFDNQGGIFFRSNGKYLSYDNSKHKFFLKDKPISLSIFKFSSENLDEWFQGKEKKRIDSYDETVEIVFLNHGEDSKQKNSLKIEKIQLIRSNESDKDETQKFSWTEEITETDSLSWSKENNFQLGGNVKLKVPHSGIQLGLDFAKSIKTNFQSSRVSSEKKTINFSEDITFPSKRLTVAKTIIFSYRTNISCKIEISRTISGRTYKYSINGNCEGIKYTDNFVHKEYFQVRNIMLVGWTGSGKSTLANVLTETDFSTESASSVGQTKFHRKSEPFEYKSNYYRIIDNIGFGDLHGNITERDIMLRIGAGINSAPEGLSQVLFVFGERFTDLQLKSYKMLKALISESGITKYTTLVRTNFPTFEKEDKWQDDRTSLVNEKPEIKEIIENSNGIIYIDNPSLSVDDERRKKINDRKRKASRIKVLDHLDQYCSDNYKLSEWDNISNSIDGYFETRKLLDNRRKELLEQGIDLAIVDSQINELEKKSSEEIKRMLQVDFQSSFSFHSIFQLVQSYIS